MIDFEVLKKKYQNDAAFNKAVNLFRKLIEEFGFMPSELREAVFLAQYLFEANNSEQIIRTQKEWEQIAVARKLLQETFAAKDVVAPDWSLK